MPRVQISADGIQLGRTKVRSLICRLLKDAVTFCKVSHFGGWLQAQRERLSRAIRHKGAGIADAEGVDKIDVKHTSLKL